MPPDYARIWEKDQDNNSYDGSVRNDDRIAVPATHQAESGVPPRILDVPSHNRPGVAPATSYSSPSTRQTIDGGHANAPTGGYHRGTIRSIS